MEPTKPQIEAVLGILREEEMLPYMARIRDVVPEERPATKEEMAELQRLDAEADAKNREFAARIARAVLSP